PPRPIVGSRRPVPSTTPSTSRGSGTGWGSTEGPDAGERRRQDRRMRRGVVLAIVVLTPLVAGCGAGPTEPARSSTAPATFAVSGPDPIPRTTELPAGAHVVVAAVGRRFHVLDAPEPGRRPRSLRATNDWGQQLWLPVIGSRVIDGAGWFHVLVPERPNGSAGGVGAGPGSTSTLGGRGVGWVGGERVLLPQGGGGGGRFRGAGGGAARAA